MGQSVDFIDSSFGFGVGEALPARCSLKPAFRLTSPVLLSDGARLRLAHRRYELGAGRVPGLVTGKEQNEFRTFR